MFKCLFPKDQNIRKHIDDGGLINQSFNLMLFHSYPITSFVKSLRPISAASTYHIMTLPFIPHSHVKLRPPHLSSCTLLHNYTACCKMYYFHAYISLWPLIYLSKERFEYRYLAQSLGFEW